jgi:hypothetical protein
MEEQGAPKAMLWARFGRIHAAPNVNQCVGAVHAYVLYCLNNLKHSSLRHTYRHVTSCQHSNVPDLTLQTKQHRRRSLEL